MIPAALKNGALRHDNWKFRGEMPDESKLFVEELKNETDTEMPTTCSSVLHDATLRCLEDGDGFGGHHATGIPHFDSVVAISCKYDDLVAVGTVSNAKRQHRKLGGWVSDV